MDIQQELNNEHSKSSRDRIVHYVSNDPTRFAVLFHLFRDGDYRVSQRAAWSVSYCAEKNPGLVSPYYKEMVSSLKKEPVHDSIKRNVLKIFQTAVIPSDLEGKLLEECFGFLMNKQEAGAIRVFSMQILANLSNKYPEIGNELRVIIEDELPYAKPAFVSRGRKILKQLTAWSPDHPR